jgi:hypothetical protein
MLEQLVALRLVGREAISDLRRLQEPALYALFDWEAEARALGIDAFLMKPVGLAELAGALRRILDQG